MKNIFTHKEFLIESRSGLYETGKRWITYFMNSIKIGKRNLEDIRFIVDHYYERDYKLDIKNLKEYLSKSTYHIDLDDFMKRFKDEIYSDPFFTESCGFLDALLYTYDDSTILSGNDIDAGTTDIDERIIKYQYGYDSYELSKKFLLQNYKTIEDFYYDCATRFWVVDYQNLIDNDYWDDIITEDDFKENQILFSTVDRLSKGSITIFDIDKFFDTFSSNEPDNALEDFAFSLKLKKEDLEKKRMKPFNYRYVNKNAISTAGLFIIGFGDVDLNNISFKKIEEYVKRIEIQYDAKKYNL